MITEETGEKNKEPVPFFEKYEKDKFLYGMYPDFENLEFEDLPYFSDVRNVFDYNKNKIVMGVQQLIELDSATNMIIRTSLPENPEFFSSAKIGEFLYISDNGDFFNNVQPTIYIMDLKTGKVTGSLKGLDDIPYDLVNLSLHGYKDDLWIATRRQVIKFDTKNSKVIDVYSLKDVGYEKNPTCDNPMEMVDEDNIVKVVEFACKNFISTYDYSTNTWSIETFDRLDPNLYINRDASDFGLELPEFIALSNIYKGNYYALSKNGIYKVTPTTLPMIYSEIKLNGIYSGANFIEAIDEDNFVITSFEDFRGPVPLEYYKGKKLADFLTILVVNVKNSTVNDVLSKSQYSQDNIDQYLEMLDGIYEGKSIIQGNEFKITFAEKGSLKMDLTTKELYFEF